MLVPSSSQNFSHIAIVVCDENITFIANNKIQCSHARGEGCKRCQLLLTCYSLLGMEVWEEFFERCQCLFASIYLTGCHIQVNIASKTQCSKHKTNFLRRERASAISSYFVRIAGLHFIHQSRDISYIVLSKLCDTLRYEWRLTCKLFHLFRISPSSFLSFSPPPKSHPENASISGSYL